MPPVSRSGPEDFSGGAVGAARVLRCLGFEVRIERKGGELTHKVVHRRR